MQEHGNYAETNKYSSHLLHQLCSVNFSVNGTASTASVTTVAQGTASEVTISANVVGGGKSSQRRAAGKSSSRMHASTQQQASSGVSHRTNNTDRM